MFMVHVDATTKHGRRTNLNPRCPLLRGWQDPRVKRISTANQLFQKNIRGLNGAVELLEFVGFRSIRGGGEEELMRGRRGKEEPFQVTNARSPPESCIVGANLVTSVRATAGAAAAYFFLT
jgi:hypothetical protein